MAFTIPYVSRRRFANTEGVNESWTFKANGIGKNNDTYPYVIINEWVSANIAQFLQLPIPPFGLFKKRDRRTLMFGSVSFEGDTKPKHVNPDQLWNRNPSLCTGILLFDILVANSDRHHGNIKVDNANRPTEVYIFDHDRALLHTEKGQGANRLNMLSGRLGISGGSATSGNRHCLIDVIQSADHMSAWIGRIHALPQTFVEDVCQRVKNMGATQAELQAMQRFVLTRSQEIDSIIQNHQDEFPNIHHWPLVL